MHQIVARGSGIPEPRCFETPTRGARRDGRDHMGTRREQHARKSGAGVPSFQRQSKGDHHPAEGGLPCGESEEPTATVSRGRSGHSRLSKRAPMLGKCSQPGKLTGTAAPAALTLDQESPGSSPGGAMAAVNNRGRFFWVSSSPA
jgi:hypothetical protein